MHACIKPVLLTPPVTDLPEPTYMVFDVIVVVTRNACDILLSAGTVGVFELGNLHALLYNIRMNTVK
jgi:hypothetical protein